MIAPARLASELRALADELDALTPGGARDPLASVERAAVAEEVASVIRHDLRNQLASIRNAAFYLKRRTQGTELWNTDRRVPQLFTLVEECIVAGTSAVEDRLTLKHLFARQVVHAHGHTCVERAVACARARESVTLEVQAGAGEVEVDLDEAALAVRCLLDNAIEAALGRVDVSARASGDGFVVTVSDDGAGVPEGERSSIFDPFRTTKSGHAGLGLNIARRIARRYKGDLVIGAAPSGATFVLTLPLAGAGGPLEGQPA